MKTELVRLSKLMAERGLCSRREADRFISSGWVRVDGQILSELGTKVSPESKIELLAPAQKAQSRLVTILLNKPIGYVSGQPEGRSVPAIRLIQPENQDPNQEEQRLRMGDLKGIAPAGRLDVDSQGLLVFTQDGRIAKALIGEGSEIEKEYLVRVQNPTGEKIPESVLEQLRFGLQLDGKKLKRAFVEQINPDQLQFVLREGRKRQIRRMCELVGLQVLGLKRVRIGRVRLGRLAEGQWRFRYPDEQF